MALFYVTDLEVKAVFLDEDTSKYMIGVLRMKKGDIVELTDGKGRKANAFIRDDNRKRCEVEIESVHEEENKQVKSAIGISLIKNASRFEWFLEKATEIGVSDIYPLLCDRTEKEKFRTERLTQIVISAMLQSKQTWLPVLHEPIAFEKILKENFEQKFIAHCVEEKKSSLDSFPKAQSRLLLIGPEGDFTEKEIRLALRNDFVPVSLGPTRLRTETAGIVGAVMMREKGAGNGS